jgi:hypothetical protein
MRGSFVRAYDFMEKGAGTLSAWMFLSVLVAGRAPALFFQLAFS